MPFGDEGEHLFQVNGVPFRVPGATREEAASKLATRLAEDRFVFADRVDRLELDPGNVAVMADAAARGETGGQGLIDAAPAGSTVFPVSLLDLYRFVSGAERRISQLGNAGRQLWAESFGDEEAVQLMQDIEEREAAIYQKLDDAGIGLEDIGELGPDMAAFMTPGLQGLRGTAFIGATLGALQVKSEGDMIDRAGDAAIGAGGALALPLLGRSLSGVAGKIANFWRERGLRMGFRGDGPSWATWRVFNQKPKQVEDIVEESLTYVVGPKGEIGPVVNRGKEIIGEAALEQVGNIVRGLPATQQRGLTDAAARGFLTRTLGDATETLSNGNVIFSPAKWRAAIIANGQKFSDMFSNTQAIQHLESVNTLARAMKNLDNVSPEGAQRAAMALIQSPKESQAVLAALAKATDPATRRSLFQMLVARGGSASIRVAGTQGAEAAAGALTDEN